MPCCRAKEVHLSVLQPSKLEGTAIFERFDRDRNEKIDSSELREALPGLGFCGMTEKFKEKDTMSPGSASFTYESLPFCPSSLHKPSDRSPHE
ncbi:unnamed protein product, partial [Musa acuminata var. zebrina]